MQGVRGHGHLPAPAPKKHLQGVRGGEHLPAPTPKEHLQGVRGPCKCSFGAGADTGRSCVPHLLLSPIRCGGPVWPPVCVPPAARLPPASEPSRLSVAAAVAAGAAGPDAASAAPARAASSSSAILFCMGSSPGNGLSLSGLRGSSSAGYLRLRDPLCFHRCRCGQFLSVRFKI